MDWDDAYANGPHIPGADTFPPRWDAEAAAFRGGSAARMETFSYGPGGRNWLDLFGPFTTNPKDVAKTLEERVANRQG